MFYYISFRLPESMPNLPIEAGYLRLFTLILMSLSVGLAVLIIAEVAFKPAVAGIKKPPRRLKPFSKLKPTPQPEVKPVARGWTVSFIAKHPRLQRLAIRMGLSMTEDALKTGVALSPYALAARYLFFALASFAVLIPASILLYAAAHPDLFPGFPLKVPLPQFLAEPFMLLAAPLAAALILLFYPRLKLKNMVGERKRAYEDEIPFFTIYASILQNVGIDLYHSMLKVIGRKTFKNVEKDALMAKRNVEFFFRSPVEALEEIGRMHPNEKMKTLLLGYTSEWRSGGDMARYLEAKAKDYLTDMKFRWERYAERVGDIGEAMVAIFFIFPLVSLMSVFLLPGESAVMIAYMLSAIIPFLMFIVVTLIHVIQPKTYDALGTKPYLSMVAAAAAFAIAFYTGTPIWLCAVVAGIGGTVLYGATIKLQMREVNMLEGALPQFLRDITEYKKMGYDINRALLKITEENTYNPVFNSLLNYVARQLQLGVRMVEVEVPVRSWLTRMVFFLLAEIVDSGGGTPSCLESLTDFVNTTVRVKKEGKARMSLYRILSAATPIGLSLVTAMMVGLFATFAATLGPGTETGFGFSFTMPPEFTEICYMLVIISSACIAVISAKATELTSKSTLWLALNLALAAVSIATSGYVVDLLLKTALTI